jgi:hypothetical protein
MGVPLLDEVVESGQVSRDEVYAWASSRDVRLHPSFTVECNLALGWPRVDCVSGVPWVVHGYAAVIDMVQATDVVFAWANPATRRSLRRLGVHAVPVCDRRLTPRCSLDGDEAGRGLARYEALALPVAANRARFCRPSNS